VIAVLARVTGRVQGVGFRWFTRGEAQRFGLTGWVRNLPDGSVEVHLEGPERVVDEMIAWLGHGPPAALVEDLVVEPVEVAGHPGFTIER
jgi:acylphosphatase